MEAHPRENVFTRRQVLVEGLVHVPQKGYARHNDVPAGDGPDEMRIIDRYVIRQVLWPSGIGLLVFTFILIIPFLIDLAETFISKGVPTPDVVRIMATLLPQALGLTIPMSLLLGLLVAFGRLSADREFVAMQACGVSLVRLLRPVLLLAVVGWAATSYVLLVAVPNANQTFRELTFQIVASRAEGEVRPRVFFEDFPSIVLYVREVPRTGGWNGVFMADTRPGQAAVYLARHGRVLLDRDRKTVEMLLAQGSRHRELAEGRYEVINFEQTIITINPETVFPREGPQKGVREMSIAELRQRAAEVEGEGFYPHTELFEIHKKFSIPAACFVFALLGLALGATARKDGKLAGFVLGLGVIFAYYVLLWFGQSVIRGHIIPPWLGAWLPNIVLAAAGFALLLRRRRVGDRPIRTSRAAAAPASARGADLGHRPSEPAWMEPSWVSRFSLPVLGILDRYVAKTYGRVLALAAIGMLGIFYIAAFLDLSDKVFRGDATWSMLAAHLWYATPQYLYYSLPLSVLIGTLVTIGALTKNSELIVMKACGISLYRAALPVLVSGILVGGVLLLIEQTVLGPSNRRAEAIRHVMRGGSPQTFDVLDRRWIVGSGDEIYHYGFYDPRERQLSAVSVYEFDSEMQSLVRRSYAERALYAGDRSGDRPDVWRAERGWTREFGPGGDTLAFSGFGESELSLEPAAYFQTQQPDPDYMSYTQLRRYVRGLRNSGFDVSEQEVALERKISFPFAALIMALLAVPFAVSIGRGGTMFSVGAGIVLAIAYWIAFSIFAAIGAGGAMPPVLAAWAPNLLFGAGAVYLLLTVRT
jgi:LPS export ABC transporter permease LptG/LPS export ABC transporter permease LptF